MQTLRNAIAMASNRQMPPYTAGSSRDLGLKLGLEIPFFLSDLMGPLGALPLLIGPDLTFRTLAQGEGGYPEYQNSMKRVIKTDPDWQAFWKLWYPAPPVDFLMEMVVAVTMGEVTGIGHSINIDRIKSNGTRLQIFVSRNGPQGSGLVPQVENAPYHFVAAPRTDLPPEFIGG